MLLTVFIASFTFGTVAELQIRPVRFCAPTDCAAMTGRSSLRVHFHFFFKIVLPAYFPGRIAFEIPGQQKENQNVGQGNHQLAANRRTPEHKAVQIHGTLCHCQPLCLNRQYKKQKKQLKML